MNDSAEGVQDREGFKGTSVLANLTQVTVVLLMLVSIQKVRYRVKVSYKDFLLIEYKIYS